MTLQEQITEAQAAYHALVTGAMPRVVVDQNGERLEYAAANRDALALYILRLQQQITPLQCEDLSKYAPASFLF